MEGYINAVVLGWLGALVGMVIGFAWLVHKDEPTPEQKKSLNDALEAHSLRHKEWNRRRRLERERRYPRMTAFQRRHPKIWPGV
jgi:hypothetical protein